MLRFIVFASVLCFVSAGGSYGGAYSGVVRAAILSHHNVQHYDVPSQGYIHPTTIDVPANILPVNFIFRSASSPVNVEAKHEGTKGSYKETSSHDEPHILKHTVTKPIIQEVREIISPFRRIVQTVEPVREEIHTNVARGVKAEAGGFAEDGQNMGYSKGFEGESLGGLNGDYDKKGYYPNGD